MKKTLMIATLSAIFAFAGASLITTFANESKTTNTTVESSTSTKTEKQSRTLPDYATLLATETISLAEAEKIALEAVPNATIIEYDYHLAHKNDATPTYSFELQNGTTLTEVTINAVDGSITETETKTTTESTTYPNATITFEQAQTTALSTVADASVVGFKFNGDTTTPSYTFTLFANDTTTRVTIDALTGEQIESAAKGSRKTATESTTETTTESTTETNSTSSATPSA